MEENKSKTKTASLYAIHSMPITNFNHSAKHHEDIKEIGDDLASITDFYWNKRATHLIHLLTGYIKNEYFSKTTRYFALEQVFRSSTTKKIFEKHLSEEEYELNSKKALDYLFACMKASG